MTIILTAALVFVVSYLLGSIPFGLLLTRLFGAGDIRAIGSGNIGATNVLRTGRKGLAATTLLLDAGKGYFAFTQVPALVMGMALTAMPGRWGAIMPIDMDIEQTSIVIASVAGLGVLVGHCYPVWLKFRGGKGVATMLGVSFALGAGHISIGLVCLSVWLLVALASRISSLGGMASAVAAPIALLVLGHEGSPSRSFVAMGVLMAFLVIWNHRANIARLRAGTEPRIGASE